ncbi:hypothetical protein BpsM61_00015 [Bacillus phage vB_BpsM-61]|nr:hypothetical protein BpsM61_00015 [Bacillus phage vB_BpsM-61]
MTTEHKGIDTLISSHSHLWGYTILDNGIFNTDQIGSSEKLVYIAIYSKVNSSSAVAFPSYDKLAELTGLSKSTCIRSVKRLIKVDLLEKVKKGYKSNRYIVKNLQESTVLGIDSELVVDQLEKKMDMTIDQIIAASQKPDDPGNSDKPEEKVDPVPYKKIMDHLNETVGTKYSHKGEANKKLIRARWNEGSTIEDFVNVINRKTEEWKGTKMETYLRPATLFGNKFDQYKNETPKNSSPEQPASDGIRSRLSGFLND